jgi:inhibitor of KinA sporulation pathway (predicted exonuclease)
VAHVPDDFQVTVDPVQCRVDAAPMLSTVVAEHSDWMREIGVLEAGASFAAVTWSDWDLKVCACRDLGCPLLQSDNATGHET